MGILFIDSFYSHDALSRKFEGTGLDLPLVKKMIELHGGELRLDSKLGVGTTVTLIFPPDRVIEFANATL